MNALPRLPTKSHTSNQWNTSFVSPHLHRICYAFSHLSRYQDHVTYQVGVHAARSRGSQTPNDLTRLRRQLSYVLASYMQKGRRRRCVIRFVMGLSQSVRLVHVCSAETPPCRRQWRSLTAAPAQLQHAKESSACSSCHTAELSLLSIHFADNGSSPRVLLLTQVFMIRKRIKLFSLKSHLSGLAATNTSIFGLVL